MNLSPWNSTYMYSCILFSLLFQVRAYVDSQNAAMGSAGAGGGGKDSGIKLERINHKNSDNVVEDIFVKEDGNKDGFISLEEFSGPKEDVSRHDTHHDEL